MKVKKIISKHLFIPGQVGITLNVNWYEPLDVDNEEHVEAATTFLRFQMGWFANPIFIDGDYPQVMKEKVYFFFP